MSYPKAEGAIFLNDRKQTDKHPDWRGHIEVTGDQIRKLIEMNKAGLEMKLQVAAWDRTSQGGKQYMFVSTEAYMKDEGAPQQTAAPAGHQAAPAQPAQAHGHAPPAPPAESYTDVPADDDFDDDLIPF